MAVIASVAFIAGLIRGLTGFGGPAFILAILTLFFTPYNIVSKILVVDFLANLFLFNAVYREVDWRRVATLVIPTLIFMPLGHWLLLEMSPEAMKRAMAVIIVAACVAMLAGFRYRRPMNTAWLAGIGAVSGVIFGGTYIALVAVVSILLGPYDKHQGRTMIIAWSFFTVIGFTLVAVASGTLTANDLLVAGPGAATYLLGSWIGTRGFHKSSETLFRRVAITVLLGLAVFNLLI